MAYTQRTVRASRALPAESDFRLTEKNPNPYDGEAFYNLGLALKFQGKNDEAYNSFYKSCWNAAWQDAGYYSLAQISVSRGNWEEALGEIEKSLLRNWHNLRGRHLKAMILRHLERPEEALAWIEDSLKIDAFNFGCLFEKYLITREETVLSQLRHLIKRGAPDYEALVLDYTSAGRFEEALAVAELAIGQPIGRTDSAALLQELVPDSFRRNRQGANSHQAC